MKSAQNRARPDMSESESSMSVFLKKIYYLKGEILQEYGSHLAARGQASIKARGLAKYARKL